MRDDTDKITCRTPNADGTTRIPRWKYNALHTAVLDAVGDDGIAFKDLKSAVEPRLSDNVKADLGSLGWHLTTVKLEMECAGDIARVEGRSPQYLIRA